MGILKILNRIRAIYVYSLYGYKIVIWYSESGGDDGTVDAVENDKAKSVCIHIYTKNNQ